MRLQFYSILFSLLSFSSAFAANDSGSGVLQAEEAPHCSEAQFPPKPHKNLCQKATAEQVKTLNTGAAKKDKFLAACAEKTLGSSFCSEILRPNPESLYTFRCTYSEDQPQIFLPPFEDMWDDAFSAINALEEMKTEGIRVCRIYNWWRPEPYNTNVDGEAGRHPHGTAVDVRFSTPEDQEAAFWFLCGLKNIGAVNAIGFYYRTPSLHIGVSDNPELDDIWGGVRCRKRR